MSEFPPAVPRRRLAPSCSPIVVPQWANSLDLAAGLWNILHPMNRRTSIPEVLSVWLSIAVCVAILWTLLFRAAPERIEAAIPPPSPPRRSAVPIPANPVSFKGSATRGDVTAKVVVMEFSEFQCPFCGKFWRETLPALEKDYISTGQVLFAFKHFPLERIHSFALRASVAAVCAGYQGKFFQMHDSLFEDQKTLHDESLRARAKRIGLNEQSFSRCLDGPAAESVRADAKEALRLGVAGTPAFFVGLRDGADTFKVIERIDGARPIEDFSRAIATVVAAVAQPTGPVSGGGR